MRRPGLPHRVPCPLPVCDAACSCARALLRVPPGMSRAWPGGCALAAEHQLLCCLLLRCHVLRQPCVRVCPVGVFVCARSRAHVCRGMAMRKMEIRDSAIGPPDGRGEFSRSNRLRLNLLRMPLLRSMLASARAVAVALRPIIACFTPQLGSVYRWTSTARDVGVCWCGEAKGSQHDSLCDSGLASSVQRGVSCRRVRAWRAETRGMTWVCRTK